MFVGDEWGEEDIWFLYGVFNVLLFFGFMDLIDVDKVVDYVVVCVNFDGGYGVSFGVEFYLG